MSSIGYTYLTATEKALYKSFEDAFGRYSDKVIFSGPARREEIRRAMNAVLGDHPEIVYFDHGTYSFSSSFFCGSQLFLSDALPPAKAAGLSQELEREVQRIVREIRQLDPLNAYETLLFLYEYMQDHVCYDEREYADFVSGSRNSRAVAHNACGPLLHGQGVCDGIAHAFALVAQRLGLDCSVIVGSASYRSDAPLDHAWNVVKVEDRFYHLDLTWDINGKEQAGAYFYDYFCVTDDELAVDHNWDVSHTPLCRDTALSYFKRNGCIANNLSHLDEILLRFAKSKQSVVRVRMADGVVVAEPQDEVLGKRLLKAAQAAGRSGSVRYSYNAQARCFFGEFQI